MATLSSRAVLFWMPCLELIRLVCYFSFGKCTYIYLYFKMELTLHMWITSAVIASMFRVMVWKIQLVMWFIVRMMNYCRQRNCLFLQQTSVFLKISIIPLIWPYQFYHVLSCMKLIMLSSVQLLKYTHTDTRAHGCTLAPTQSHGCRQTSLVFRLSNCANKLKGGQSAWLGSLVLVNNLLIIKDKRNKPQSQPCQQTLWHMRMGQ